MDPGPLSLFSQKLERKRRINKESEILSVQAQLWGLVIHNNNHIFFLGEKTFVNSPHQEEKGSLSSFEKTVNTYLVNY
jgi:hypothetical protein